MGVKYTRSELAKILGLSIETIKKRALKMGLKEGVKTINNKAVIAYDLSDKDLLDLQHALGLNPPLEVFETPFTTPPVVPNESPNHTDNKLVPIELFEKIIELSERYETRLETHLTRASNAESQVKLLTVTESNKDNEIHRLNALAKQFEKRFQIVLIALSIPLLIAVSLVVYAYTHPKIITKTQVVEKPVEKIIYKDRIVYKRRR